MTSPPAVGLFGGGAATVAAPLPGALSVALGLCAARAEGCVTDCGSRMIATGVVVCLARGGALAPGSGMRAVDIAARCSLKRGGMPSAYLAIVSITVPLLNILGGTCLAIQRTVDALDSSFAFL